MDLHPSGGRRQFLAWSVASAAWIAAHRVSALTHLTMPIQPAEGRPLITSLELDTAAALSAMKAFYGDALGLPIIGEERDRLQIRTGESLLTFVSTRSAGDAPFYHFAFNIPENKIVGARTWQLKRSPLLPIPADLRDPAFPDDVVDYRHWNAHSVFFLDPGGNVVEYIARHDLKNAARGPFGPKDILYASEIGLIVDDVPAAVAGLTAAAGLGQYRAGSDLFTALGDERGLLLVMKRGRILNFQRASQEKAARVFPTIARVRGARPRRHTISGFPYEVAVELD
jgi:hypothetical protein